MLDKCRYRADQGEDNEYRADDAVDQVERTHVEVGAHLVDQEGDEKPPAEGSGGDAEVAGNIVIVAELGEEEVETGKQADDKS